MEKTDKSTPQKSPSPHRIKLKKVDTDAINNEVGRIADRDRIFSSDEKEIPGSDRLSGWSGDSEDSVIGERSNLDFVEELDQVHRIAYEREEEVTPQHTPTPVGIKEEDAVNYSAMTDHELQDEADAYGIAGRTSMSRLQLIDSIRDARH